MLRSALAVALLSIACGPTTSSPSASSTPAPAAAPVYPELLDLSACQVRHAKLFETKDLGLDTDVYAWEATCAQGEIQIVETSLAKSEADLLKRAEEQAHGAVTATAAPASRDIEAGGIQARTTPVKKTLSALVDKGKPAKPSFLVSSTWKLGSHARRAGACFADNEEKVEWCHRALRSLLKDKLPGLHRSWTSYGNIDVPVPPGCAVPRPWTVACKQVGMIWTTDASQIERLFSDRTVDDAIKSKGGTVRTNKARCTVGAHPGECEIRTYTLPHPQGGTMTQVAIFARSTEGKSPIGIGCSAGPIMSLPKVCASLLQLH